ncbi:unnamed protein product [Schistosoma margrebowiei]|uniref:Uncharacterized protein n=1 Tax=Schistosoma margrebowiei TaxID=48269 RepID=A0A183MCF4_9TREM|nr:unnamed protein product [Schistosoma margrebowiei]
MKNIIINSDDTKSSNDDSKPKFELPVEVKEDVKNENCGSSTNTGDSKKDLKISKVDTLEKFVILKIVFVHTIYISYVYLVSNFPLQSYVNLKLINDCFFTVLGTQQHCTYTTSRLSLKTELFTLSQISKTHIFNFSAFRFTTALWLMSLMINV